MNRNDRRPTEEAGGVAAEVRLQKYLSQAGISSRRDGEALILQGRVRVNGAVVTRLGSKVRPGVDRVEVDGEAVATARNRWICFNKPTGSLTTRRDTHGRRTIYDLLPSDFKKFGYVGRLDQDTSGLLLLTNDGDLAAKILRREVGVEREYRVWVEGFPTGKELGQLKKGIDLDGVLARAAEVRLLRKGRGEALLKLVLTEGRKREVRRLCDAIDHPVKRLKRVRFGPVSLSDLPTGSWRDLTKEEYRGLWKVLDRNERSVKKSRVRFDTTKKAQKKKTQS